MLWMYHSRASEDAGAAAGLIGPILVYPRGTLRHDPAQ
jgi:hypothetical protein